MEIMNQPPFTLYVISHPECAAGKRIATHLRQRFGTNRYRNIVGGAGVTVLFRNNSAPGAATPLPIDWNDADAIAVVVLVDRALADDAAWTRYVKGLAGEAEERGLGARVFPVTLDAGSLNIRLGVQAIRWERWTGSDLEREQRLFRELTYEFSRMLRHSLEQHTDKDNLQRYRRNIQIFLSHSKHDVHGEAVAGAIRDWLHDNSAMSSFLDVHDIPAGTSFSSIIDDSIQDGAVVAIYTDSYSSREWCRHEVMEAKRRNTDLDARAAALQGFARLALIGQDGRWMSMEDRHAVPPHEPDEHEWGSGLTAMRKTMRGETNARVVLGGRVEGYRGRMPGIAEETLLSLEAGQPLFLIGGFGGCARDIAETIGLVNPWVGSRPAWPSRQQFTRYTGDDLRNGLSMEENHVLARTPHLDQAVTLVMQGLRRLRNGRTRGRSTRKG